MNTPPLPQLAKFIVPQLFTVLRILLGAWSLVAVLEQNADLAVTLITLGVVTDGLDGPMARLLTVATRFGASLEIFANYLCYLVAPWFVSYLLAEPSVGNLSLVLLTIPLVTGSIHYARPLGEGIHRGLATVVYAVSVVTFVFLELNQYLAWAWGEFLFVVIVFGLSLMMVMPVSYPQWMRIRSLFLPSILCLVIMPFALTKPLASLILAGVFGYVFLAPFIVDKGALARRLLRHLQQPPPGRG